MGYTVGMPSMKLSNIEGARGKHCGNFKRVAAEALGERLGKDLDINPELSHNNINFGFGTAEELIKYSDEHVNQMNAEREQRGERKIRTDAVRMCATIIKPPAEMMLQLSREQQEKFLRDSLDCFKNIIDENNIKAAAIHFDELIPHLHIFWEPMTQDGRLCGKEMHNLKYLGRLNREMPEMLRQKGWQIVDDCNAYDSVEEQKKREEMGEPAYREYRKGLRAKRGRESSVFKSEAQSDVDELQKQADELQKKIETSKKKLSNIEKKTLEYLEKHSAYDVFEHDISDLMDKVEELLQKSGMHIAMHKDDLMALMKKMMKKIKTGGEIASKSQSFANTEIKKNIKLNSDNNRLENENRFLREENLELKEKARKLTAIEGAIERLGLADTIVEEHNRHQRERQAINQHNKSKGSPNH